MLSELAIYTNEDTPQMRQSSQSKLCRLVCCVAWKTRFTWFYCVYSPVKNWKCLMRAAHWQNPQRPCFQSLISVQRIFSTRVESLYTLQVQSVSSSRQYPSDSWHIRNHRHFTTYQMLFEDYAINYEMTHCKNIRHLLHEIFTKNHPTIFRLRPDWQFWIWLTLFRLHVQIWHLICLDARIFSWRFPERFATVKQDILQSMHKIDALDNITFLLHTMLIVSGETFIVTQRTSIWMQQMQFL